MRFLAFLLIASSAVACGPNQSIERAALAGRDGSVGSTSSSGSRTPPRGAGNPAVDRKAVDGTPCQAGGDCRSGTCVDGVCCESPCAGTCMACDVAEQAGKCLPVPDEQDPDDDCAQEPATTCGRDGVCDGKGACRKYKPGTECAPAGCMDGTQRAASTCDGNGVCQPGATKSCAPAMCIDQSCGEPCDADTDCMTGLFCDNGTCRVKREQAATCERDAQCSTGFCADKVCCATACKDKCHACNTAGSVGTCTAAGDGRDPRRECAVQGIQTCGNAGGCNGRGACRLHTPGTPCGFGTCSGSTLVGASSCDGMGACKPGPKKDCDPYVCNGMVCWNACATNEQCKSGRTCRINACE